MEFFPYDANNPHPVADDDSQGCTSSGKDDEFYEVEEVIGRRLSKDALCYEYKVRFKGYGSAEDMWLPASFFNRPIQFESTSKFGRKRKHTLDPENVIEDNKRGRHSGSDHGGPNALESGNRLNRSKKMKTKREKTAAVASDEHKRSVLSNETSVPLTNRRKTSGLCRDKGKLFRSSLDTNTSPCTNGAKEPLSIAKESGRKDIELTKVEMKTVEGQIKAGVRSHYLDRRKVTPTKSSKVPPKDTVTNSSNDNSVLKNAVNVDVITVEDVSEDKEDRKSVV